MTYRKLLVPLNGTERDNQVLTAAFEIAKPCKAHVMGIYVRPDPAEVLPYLGEGVSASVIQEIMDAARASAGRSAAAARSSLDQYAKKYAAPTMDSAGLSASFCLRDGPADLVVSRVHRGHASDSDQLFEHPLATKRRSESGLALCLQARVRHGGTLSNFTRAGAKALSRNTLSSDAGKPA